MWEPVQDNLAKSGIWIRKSQFEVISHEFLLGGVYMEVGDPR